MRQLLQKTFDLVVGDTWPKRRRVVYVALLFCAMVVAASLGAAIAARDMTAVLAIAGNAYFLGGSVIFAYVFGSIYDDVDKRRHLPKDPPESDEAGE